LLEQLLRAPCLDQRESMRNERLDFMISQEVKQDEQVLPKQGRLKSFERLDAAWLRSALGGFFRIDFGARVGMMRETHIPHEDACCCHWRDRAFALPGTDSSRPGVSP